MLNSEAAAAGRVLEFWQQASPQPTAAGLFCTPEQLRAICAPRSSRVAPLLIFLFAHYIRSHYAISLLRILSPNFSGVNDVTMRANRHHTSQEQFHEVYSPRSPSTQQGRALNRRERVAAVPLSLQTRSLYKHIPRPWHAGVGSTPSLDAISNCSIELAHPSAGLQACGVTGLSDL